MRVGKGGIDWWRYQQKIVLPKLLPFAQACAQERETIVQEDNAASHSQKHYAVYYSAANIVRMLWPANSPDLNIIEPCWAHLK